jgi:hypothetical protein
MITTGMAWYTPESWRQLEEAIAAAGMPKAMLASSYAEFVAQYDAFARGFERQGVRVEKTPIDVPHMVAWCKRWGLSINAAGRSKYAAALAGHGGDREELDRRGFVDRTRAEH